MHAGVPAVPPLGTGDQRTSSSVAIAKPTELSGIYSDIMLVRASDDTVHKVGQDGGLVSAILIWCLENEIIDAALVSYLEGDGSSWKAIPGVATTRDEVIARAGSRYTYSANTLALPMALERGLERIALVGMSCQSSVPPVMKQRKVGKVAQAISLNIGLLCSKTFDDAIFEELFLAKYGLQEAPTSQDEHQGRVPDLDAATATSTRSR